MTALPKRKPAPRPTMAPQPEPVRPVPSWEDLTAPLDTSAPVIVTPAARTEWAALTDQLRAGQAADRDDVTQWHAQACQATFGPLDDWLHHAPLPAMMP